VSDVLAGFAGPSRRYEKSAKQKELGRPDNNRALLGFSLVVLCAAFVAPALLNGQPFLYPDSVQYYHAGAAALRKLASLVSSHYEQYRLLSAADAHGIATHRSVYYGILFVVAHYAGGAWGLPTFQALISAAALILVLRHIWPAPIHVQVLAAALIAFTSGLGFFSMTAMPDVFAGLVVVAMAMSFKADLTPAERHAWLLLVLGGCLFHKGIIMLAVVTLGACLLVFRKEIGQRKRQLLRLAAAIAVAAIGQLAVIETVQAITGHDTIQMPFLLARFVGDGTAERYLAAECPIRHYTTCKYLSRMPMTENEFLWTAPGKTAMGTATKEEKLAISREADEIVLGTIRMFPLSQASLSLRNAARQFADVGVSEFGLAPAMKTPDTTSLRPNLDSYQSTPVARGTMPLSAISLMMAIVYWVSLLVGTAIAVLRPRTIGTLPAILAAGLVANAAVCGALAGVFDRYQGRIVWLAPLFLIAVLRAAAQDFGLPLRSRLPTLVPGYQSAGPGTGTSSGL
jgi:hypothetical protein